MRSSLTTERASQSPADTNRRGFFFAGAAYLPSMNRMTGRRPGASMLSLDGPLPDPIGGPSSAPCPALTGWAFLSLWPKYHIDDAFPA
jgi:hypothetical protein